MARRGRSHEGHDVFARCATRLAAAFGDTVKISKLHGAAGNYIVIDGDGTAVDYAYMHLRDVSPLENGARVLTGRLIGHVGGTGDAHGTCTASCGPAPARTRAARRSTRCRS